MRQKPSVLLSLALCLALSLASGCTAGQPSAQPRLRPGASWVDDVGFAGLSREEQARRLSVDLIGDSPGNMFKAVSPAADGGAYAVGSDNYVGLIVRYGIGLARLAVAKEPPDGCSVYWDVAAAADGTVYVLGNGESGNVIIRYTAELREVARVGYDGLLGSSLALSPDGTVYAAGYIPKDGGDEAAVLSYDADLAQTGLIVWDDIGNDTFLDVAVAADGTVYAAGSSTVQYSGIEIPFIARFDPSLTTMLGQYRGEQGGGRFVSLAADADGSLLAACVNPSPGAISVSRFDAGLEEVSTAVIQERTDEGYGSIAVGFRMVLSLAAGLDGSIYLAGYVYTPAEEGGRLQADATIIKLDGGLQELNMVGWGYGDMTAFRDVCVAADGTVYAVGEAYIDVDGEERRAHAMMVR